VRAGTIDDQDGKSAGDVDLIIFNDAWFPSVRAGATSQSRKYHFPIEGVYAVVEVKSSLSFDTLDDAMKRLVCCHRLKRPSAIAPRQTENHSTQGLPQEISNPLYSAIVALERAQGINLDDVVRRFVANCQNLALRERVRGLCVLKKGFLSWGQRVPGSQVKPALFRRTDVETIPILHDGSKLASGLYPFINELLIQLFHSVLNPEDLSANYGLGEYEIRVLELPKTQ